ncbi:hypothetical protein [Deinococcus aquiradiocola]|uniref:Uncharacterized protein n=1 Tax=Deinococcus aquiradiocola TaxID=393059 RepID=A0A917PLV3_9DEIO|nr:hypothetical protein [Deinococcus aquiradiocola]GGJ83800.1 hypothetical protein GCM10008939_29580 [Deinococcus aquiradiocola]
MNLADVQRRLTAAEALWQKRGPRTYELSTEAQGQVSFKMTVQVSDHALTGQIATDQLRLPGQPAVAPVTQAASAASADRFTVPGLFAQVHRLLRRHQPLKAVGRTETGAGVPALPGSAGVPACGILNVTFDVCDGHLRALQYDTVFTIDDEFTLKISPLKPLP